MTDLPIIFSAPMVLALLDGRKSMTRRLLYSERKIKNGIVPASAEFLRDHPRPFPKSPDLYVTLSGWHKVKPGDRLYVRERIDARGPSAALKCCYAADGALVHDRNGHLVPYGDYKGTSIPAIHMRRTMSRLTLIVTATKIERLQEISEQDAMAEGAPWYVGGHGIISDAEYTADPGYQPSKRGGFEHLWNSLHGEGSWVANPEVVSLSFRVIKANIDVLSVEATA